MDSGNKMEQSLKDQRSRAEKDATYSYLVTPGETIVNNSVYMRGHGVTQEKDALVASVAGQVVRVNKLICVIPYYRKYVAEIGDVVIGRVTDLGPRYWRISIDSYQDAIMLLASIHLPDKVQRRKLESDELRMRSFLKEGDLLSAEIHSFFHDGAAFLQVRNSKHGKLKNGIFITVPPALVKRLKTHVFKVNSLVSVVLGRNGWVWVYASKNSDTEDDEENNQDVSYFKENDELIPEEIRSISRVHNCILVLSNANIYINPTTISKALDVTAHLEPVDINSSSVISWFSTDEFRSSFML